MTPARRRKADLLLSRMASLDGAADQSNVEEARDRLHKQARQMGMRLVSFTVTEEPIPDPALDALPAADLERIEAISGDMRANPHRHVAELKRLAAKHPHIPVLQNHLAGALEAAGQRHRASQVLSETTRRFPTYIFAFCNYVIMLVSQGRLEEASALVETGSRGPVFTLVDFDPTRNTFHISEALSHAAMVGHYMLATGRREAAEVQLRMLRNTAPSSPQCRSLAAAMGRTDEWIEQAAALLQMASEPSRRQARRANGGRKRRANGGVGRANETPRPLASEDSVDIKFELKPDMQSE